MVGGAHAKCVVGVFGDAHPGVGGGVGLQQLDAGVGAGAAGAGRCIHPIERGLAGHIRYAGQGPRGVHRSGPGGHGEGGWRWRGFVHVGDVDDDVEGHRFFLFADGGGNSG